MLAELRSAISLFVLDDVQRAVAVAPAGFGAFLESPLVDVTAGFGDIRMVFQRFLYGLRAGRRVGPSNYKIGVGVGSGFEGAEGANFEIGTPDTGVGEIRAADLSVRLDGPDGQPWPYGPSNQSPCEKGVWRLGGPDGQRCVRAHISLY